MEAVFVRVVVGLAGLESPAHKRRNGRNLNFREYMFSRSQKFIIARLLFMGARGVSGRARRGSGRFYEEKTAVFQGLETETRGFSKHWKKSLFRFPMLGKVISGRRETGTLICLLVNFLAVVGFAGLKAPPINAFSCSDVACLAPWRFSVIEDHHETRTWSL